jgi:hypothetical protein
MDDLATLIRDLDDATVERILAAVAQQRQRSGAAALPADAALAHELAAAADVTPDAASVSAGDLARQSLLLLADDPTMQPVLRNFIEHPPARSYVDLTTFAVGTAALVVLQSYVKIERDAKGKWVFKFEKKPMSNPLLKLLIEKLTRYLGGK